MKTSHDTSEKPTPAADIIAAIKELNLLQDFDIAEEITCPDGDGDLSPWHPENALTKAIVEKYGSRIRLSRFPAAAWQEILAAKWPSSMGSKSR